MAKITADHDVTVSRYEEKDGKQVRVERVTLKPGDDVPDWASDQVDEEYTRERTEGEDGYEQPDQTRDELVKIAKVNKVPIEDDWDKDRLTQAIRLHNEAVASGGSVDWDAFKESGGADVGEVGAEGTTGVPDTEASDDALRAEYKQLTGEEADGRWRRKTLVSKVTEAREANGGAG